MAKRFMTVDEAERKCDELALPPGVKAFIVGEFTQAWNYVNEGHAKASFITRSKKRLGAGQNHQDVMEGLARAFGLNDEEVKRCYYGDTSAHPEVRAAYDSFFAE